MARALDLPRIKVHIYEIDPVAAELASVIAHELGHVALGHSRRRMIDFSGQNAMRTALAMVLDQGGDRHCPAGIAV